MENQTIFLIVRNENLRIRFFHILSNYFTVVVSLKVFIFKLFHQYTSNSRTIVFIEESLLSFEVNNYLNSSKCIIFVISNLYKTAHQHSKFEYVYKDEDEHAIIEKIRTKIEETDIIANTKFISERERDVIKLIAKGLTNKEIADQLFISPHTVITHRKNITNKLNIKSISGLTVYAILNNIITIEEAQL